MFTKTKRKLAEKMGQSVKSTIEPIKKKVEKTVDNKVDLYSRILRLCVLIGLFIDGTRRASHYDKESNTSPYQIVINNYVSEKDGETK